MPQICGSKSFQMLNNMGLIQAVLESRLFHYCVSGELRYGCNTLSEVYASEVPNILGSDVMYGAIFSVSLPFWRIMKVIEA